MNSAHQLFRLYNISSIDFIVKWKGACSKWHLVRQMGRDSDFITWSLHTGQSGYRMGGRQDAATGLRVMTWRNSLWFTSQQTKGFPTPSIPRGCAHFCSKRLVNHQACPQILAERGTLHPEFAFCMLRVTKANSLMVWSNTAGEHMWILQLHGWNQSCGPFPTSFWGRMKIRQKITGVATSWGD